MHKLEDETKAGCPLGNKAMQTNLTGVWSRALLACKYPHGSVCGVPVRFPR